MASIIPGYEYDIFISYRQKDNKHDGWVSEFAENLKHELGSAMKEDMSIYFDANPTDSLSETYDVGRSLEGKLNCLIFVPVISQTYCDPKSFAWQHELVAFNKKAKIDNFGTNVRLNNGNVTSRILPVRIHDLDVDDQKLYEKETGGLVRGVEFIYRQPGVNRPLRPDDLRKDNLNSTVYRDQINKIANSIKEILQALRNIETGSAKDKISELSDSNINTLIMSANPIREEKTRKSILVLPFVNMSPNPHDEYFSDGLTEEIITSLAHLRSLRVISRSTSMIFKGTLKDVITIGRDLHVEYVLEGSVRKAENKIRIATQLIDARTDEHLWAERFDGSIDNIFDVQEMIAGRVVDALKIELSPEEKKDLMKRPINNTAAYNMWILAKNEFNKLSSAGIERGIVLTKKALEIEGENAQLYATLAYMYWAYYDFGIKHDAEVFEFMEQYVLKSLSLDPDNAEALSSKGLILYKKGDLPGYIRYARPAADMGGDTVFLFSFILAELGKLEEADVYADWAMASNPLIYMALWARACVDMFMGKIAEGYNLLSDARNRLAPGEPFVGWWVGQLAWYAGDNATAYEEFKKGAESGSSPWQEFCNLNKLAMDSDIKGVSEQIQTSGIVEFSITDEFYPICIANTLVITGEFDEALKWLDRSVSWGFSNYKFLSEYNRFLEPLRNDSRFKKIIEKARLQQLNFTGL